MPTIKRFVPKRNLSPTVTFLIQDELKRLVSTIKNKRDRAIILMAYRHGHSCLLLTNLLIRNENTLIN